MQKYKHINKGQIMKRIFALSLVFATSTAFAINPESPIGQEFIEAGMEGCIEEAVDSGLGFGLASEYCYCALVKTAEELSLEQITEYYKHGREIEKIMDKAAKDCIKSLSE
jgi:hypothetical protein